MSGATLAMTISRRRLCRAAGIRACSACNSIVSCAGRRQRLLRPPANTLSYATVAAAIFAAGLALLGLSLSSAMFAAVIIALGQTVMLAISSGMYGNYASRLRGWRWRLWPPRWRCRGRSTSGGAKRSPHPPGSSWRRPHQYCS
jgi:hypothetical protein